MSAIQRRDAALARIRRTRGWTIAAATALTAGIAGLVSAVAPGRTLSKHASVAATRTSGAGATTLSSGANSAAEPKMPPLADPQSLGLGGSSGSGSSGSGGSAGDSSGAPGPSDPSQAQSAPAPAPPQAAPAPAPGPADSGSGGPVVSGGS